MTSEPYWPTGTYKFWVSRDQFQPRVLRAKYLLRHRPEEVKAASPYFRAITDLVEVIQSLKHKAGNKDVDAVARIIPTVEGLLIFVLL